MTQILAAVEDFAGIGKAGRLLRFAMEAVRSLPDSRQACVEVAPKPIPVNGREVHRHPREEVYA